MNALELCQDLVGRQDEPHRIDKDTEVLPRVTQLQGSKARTQIQLYMTPAPHILSQPRLVGALHRTCRIMMTENGISEEDNAPSLPGRTVRPQSVPRRLRDQVRGLAG